MRLGLQSLFTYLAEELQLQDGDLLVIPSGAAVRILCCVGSAGFVQSARCHDISGHHIVKNARLELRLLQHRPQLVAGTLAL